MVPDKIASGPNSSLRVTYTPRSWPGPGLIPPLKVFMFWQDSTDTIAFLCMDEGAKIMLEDEDGYAKDRPRR